MTKKSTVPIGQPVQKTLRHRTDDPLWKAVTEQTFGHFLFFFGDAKQVFDMEKPFVYLDKGFESLFPNKPNGKDVRYVYKLVKVQLGVGGEQFVLVHVDMMNRDMDRNTRWSISDFLAHYVSTKF